jgi:chemotaxis protein methyltransferase CheR
MKLPGGSSVLDRLRLLVSELIGFALEGDKLERLEHAAHVRVGELSLGALEAYVERLYVPDFQREELTYLAETLADTESFFYGNADQIRALVEAVLPARARRGGQRLRILCAGCAAGEEPYSLAIALREHVPELEAWNVQILGVDVNRALLAKAARARYTPAALRSLPAATRERYFSNVGGDLVLDPSVTKMVTFRAHNLAAEDPLFFRALACDVIFCRNVISNFTAEAASRAVRHLTEALLPGGYLFLGHGETLRGLSREYRLCHTRDTFYYQRREPVSLLPPRSSSRPPPPPELFALPSAADGASSWLDAVQRASRRLGRPGPNDAPGATATTSAAPPEAKPDLYAVLELLQRDRFAEARGLIDRLPAVAGKQSDALLFSAVLLANEGFPSEAERVCDTLLTTDDLDAGAHFVKALCREHEGDGASALTHDAMAAHLDPSFAMPHLHAGLLARRAGDTTLARREIGEALVLLEREEPSRLALFGAGFSRAALTLLCRTELDKLGAGS